jgi:hypothetical protein
MLGIAKRNELLLDLRISITAHHISYWNLTICKNLVDTSQFLLLPKQCGRISNRCSHDLQEADNLISFSNMIQGRPECNNFRSRFSTTRLVGPINGTVIRNMAHKPCITQLFYNSHLHGFHHPLNAVHCFDICIMQVQRHGLSPFLCTFEFNNCF